MKDFPGTLTGLFAAASIASMATENNFFDSTSLLVRLGKEGWSGLKLSGYLVAAAKQQLKFLAAVDRNHRIYEEKVRYKSDCEKPFGDIFDNSGVVSSTLGTFSENTKEVWLRLYPGKIYVTSDISQDFSEEISALENHTSYDLVSAVQRKIPFTYHVSRPHMSHDLFLEDALARYKGFLYLIKRNREDSINLFCVPTYDIDLMRHSHQLHPVSYCKDSIEAHGKAMEHDDTDSDRSRGKELDVFWNYETMRRNIRYKAGAMYHGAAPSPVSVVPHTSKNKSKRLDSFDDHLEVQVLQTKFVEGFLEIVGVKNFPDELKGRLSVSCSKSHPDSFFSVNQKLRIFSESVEKMVASLRCEPKGDILFDLLSYDISSNMPIKRGAKILGCAFLSLEDYLIPVSKLSDERWLQLSPPPGCESTSS